MSKNSRVVAKAEASIHVKVDYRAELQQHLDEIRLEYMHAQETVRGKNNELIEANLAIRGYYTNDGQLNESGQRHQASVKSAHKRAEETQLALEAARENSSALKDEIDGLEHDLAQSRGGLKSSQKIFSF